MKAKLTAILGNLATFVMVGAALIIAAAAIRNNFWPARKSQSSLAQERIPRRQWNHAVAKARIANEKADSTRTLLIFTDYECPYCKALEVILDSLEKMPDFSVRRAYRNYPLQQHQYADTAALYAVCAASGGRFEQLHREMFAYSGSLTLSVLDSLTTRAGMDRAVMRNCMSSDSARQIVDADISVAKELRIPGTPMVYFNGRLIAPRLTVTSLADAIRDAKVATKTTP